MIDLFTQADLTAHAHAALNTGLTIIAILLLVFLDRRTRLPRD